MMITGTGTGRPRVERGGRRTERGRSGGNPTDLANDADVEEKRDQRHDEKDRHLGQPRPDSPDS